MKPQRFNSTGTTMGQKKVALKKEHPDYQPEYKKTEKIIGIIPRLSCGKRDCTISTDAGELIKVITYYSCIPFNRTKSVENREACGGFAIEYKHHQAVMGFRHENTGNYGTFIYNPSNGLRRKEHSLVLGSEPAVRSKIKPMVLSRPLVRISTKSIAVRGGKIR